MTAVGEGTSLDVEGKLYLGGLPQDYRPRSIGNVSRDGDSGWAVAVVVVASVWQGTLFLTCPDSATHLPEADFSKQVQQSHAGAAPESLASVFDISPK